QLLLPAVRRQGKARAKTTQSHILAKVESRKQKVEIGVGGRAKPPKATPRPYTRHILGIDSGVQSHPKATPKPHQSHTKATPRPHQGHTKATPRPHQGHTKATLRPHQSHPKATPKPPQSHPKATPKPPQGHTKASFKLRRADGLHL